MPRASPSLSDRLKLDRTAPLPVHRQIYQRVRDAIAAGTLRPGERLPSARALASQLGVARGTADAGYALLVGEGYVVTRGPAGSIVSPQLASGALPARRRLPAMGPPRMICRRTMREPSGWACRRWTRFPERSGVVWCPARRGR